MKKYIIVALIAGIAACTTPNLPVSKPPVVVVPAPPIRDTVRIHDTVVINKPVPVPKPPKDTVVIIKPTPTPQPPKQDPCSDTAVIMIPLK